jgi:predicted DCC family thiol-disulfide oxidoreductase YuxK
MQASIPQYILFYDDACGLCQRSVLFWKQFLKYPKSASYQGLSTPEAHAFFEAQGISLQDAHQRMCLFIPSENRVLWAETAVATMLQRCVFPWNVVGVMMQWPGIRQWTPPLYAWVARNRHRFLPPL